jgi:iron complex outermembrane receptor protein
MKSHLFASVALAICTAATVCPSQAVAAPQQAFFVPAGDLKSVLDAYVRQSGRQLIYRADEVHGVHSPGAFGALSNDAALAALLAGTGFTTHTDPSGAIAIVRGSSSQAREPGEAVAGSAAAANESAEIVVTGTNIRGATPASPVIVFDKQAIERTGYASARELIINLPQNYGGGAAETTGPSPVTDAGRNVGATSTVDLRGLGAGSTLTLLNGHRLAPNGEGFAVDVSAIPLSAVKRVEILTDGASAIYGSDAVGGVVNFILDDAYEGGETTLQYGGATRGGAAETRLAQTLGHRWGTGGLMATYEYYARTPAKAGDRPFASELPADFLLTADQHRNSGFVHGDQQVGPIKFFGDVLYSDQTKALNTLFGTHIKDHLTTLSATVGATADLGRGWALEATGLLGRQNDSQVATTLEGDAFPTRYRDQITSFDAKADGPLFHLPGGDVRAAFGGGERHEKLEVVGGSPPRATRKVTAAFGEISIPLVGEANAMSGVRMLRADVAVRWERYSDFGSTTNPKVGLTWIPLDGLKLRGTWGTAYRAPTLIEKYGDILAVLFDAPDPASPTGTTLSLISLGGNPDLGPQRAKTWTVGADWTPPSAPGLKLSATYFQTNYRDRIQIVAASIFDILPNEALYPTAVVRNPGATFVNQFIGSADTFLNFFGPFDPADVGAFVIAQPLNVAQYRVSGIDLLAGYHQPTSFGELDWTLNTAWLLNAQQRTTATSPTIDRLNKIFYSPALRVRGGVTWTRKALSATVSAAYTGSYTNNTVTPTQSVRSYKTVDLQLAYTPEHFWGLRASVSVRNVFDEQPPFVESPTFTGGGQFNFDPANADPIGRFVSAQLTKRW